MQILLSPLVDEKLRRVKRQDNKLFKKVKKQLNIFSTNPKHPSLRLHKLTGKSENAWSISVSMNIRMIYKVIDGNAYFTDIDTHDEVYGK